MYRGSEGETRERLHEMLANAHEEYERYGNQEKESDTGDIDGGAGYRAPTLRLAPTTMESDAEGAEVVRGRR